MRARVHPRSRTDDALARRPSVMVTSRATKSGWRSRSSPLASVARLSREEWMGLGLLCAIGLSVWSAVAATSQTAVPAALSATLRDHVKDERFEIVTSIRGLPLGVREGLQTLFGSQTLDIAESRAEFQGTDLTVSPKRPLRRLVAAGCSNRSLPGLLRARRERPHVVGGTLSLDARRDPLRVGWSRARRPGNHRRRPERRAFRHGQRPRHTLVAGRRHANVHPAKPSGLTTCTEFQPTFRFSRSLDANQTRFAWAASKFSSTSPVLAGFRSKGDGSSVTPQGALWTLRRSTRPRRPTESIA